MAQHGEPGSRPRSGPVAGFLRSLGDGRHRGESGVTALEYALSASLIAMVIIIAVVAVGEDLAKLYDKVVDHFPT